MTADQIRNVLKYEANNNLVGTPASALHMFVSTATDAELIRFREILIGSDDQANTDWANDPNSVASHFHY